MIRVEWIRQVRRIRTWACLAGLAAVPIILSIALYVDPPRERRELNVFTLVTASGLNVGIVALFFMSQFFLVGVIAAFAGESVSGEATWGTLRYLLVRPVSRTRLVGAGVRVSAIGPHQRTLEDIVLSVTGTGSDHIAGDIAGDGDTSS